jgi:hypothetical protein
MEGGLPLGGEAAVEACSPDSSKWPFVSGSVAAFLTSVAFTLDAFAFGAVVFLMLAFLVASFTVFVFGATFFSSSAFVAPLVVIFATGGTFSAVDLVKRLPAVFFAAFPSPVSACATAAFVFFAALPAEAFVAPDFASFADALVVVALALAIVAFLGGILKIGL